MAVSDSYYWYNVQQSGGCGACGGGGGGGELPPMMSVFGSFAPKSLLIVQSSCGFWCRTGWSDIVGGIAGAAATVQVSGGAVVVVPQVAVIAAGVGSVAASALYAISAM